MAKKKKSKRNPITAWSYSRLACYEECPRKHNYRNILKLDEPKGEAMFRGIKIHDEGAKYLEGKTDRVPVSYLKFMREMVELKGFNPIVEQKWAFNKKMKPTSWMAKDCWLRVTLDVSLIYGDGTGEAIDHKTGKMYDDYEDQLNLFAHSMFKMFPNEITTNVTVRLWYLDADEEVTREVSKAEAQEHFDDLTGRAEIMMTAKRFPPNPSWKCGGVRKDGTSWGCHWRRSNGGPCEYG